MSKKKIFKPVGVLAPRLTVNRRWTIWRQFESKMAALLNNGSQYSLMLNSLMSNQANEVSISLQKKQATIHHLTYSTKTRNYCYYVGRARAVTKGLFITRHTLHKFVRFGMLPGFTKARQ